MALFFPTSFFKKERKILDTNLWKFGQLGLRHYWRNNDVQRVLYVNSLHNNKHFSWKADTIQKETLIQWYKIKLIQILFADHSFLALF